MDELIKMVSEKAGISADQAKTAVTSVFEFLKGKLPMLGDQLQGLVGGGGDGSNPLANAESAARSGDADYHDHRGGSSERRFPRRFS